MIGMVFVWRNWSCPKGVLYSLIIGDVTGGVWLDYTQSLWCLHSAKFGYWDTQFTYQLPAIHCMTDREITPCQYATSWPHLLYSTVMAGNVFRRSVQEVTPSSGSACQHCRFCKWSCNSGSNFTMFYEVPNYTMCPETSPIVNGFWWTGPIPMGRSWMATPT